MTVDVMPQTERRKTAFEELRIRFRLIHSARSASDEEPLRVLIFRPHRSWQGYGMAHPIGGGFYDVVLPRLGHGVYHLFFACPRMKAGYSQLPHLILQSAAEGVSVMHLTPQTPQTLLEC